MSQSRPTPADIERAIRNIPDFPKPGIQFKDITPVLADARLFSGCIDLLTEKFKPGSVDAVVGIDARGFIFAAAAAVKLEAGFVPVRKKGKLPYQTHEQQYNLEYGTATVAVHVDALKPGSRVLLIDDLLATGGTAAAAAARAAARARPRRSRALRCMEDGAGRRSGGGARPGPRPRRLVR